MSLKYILILNKEKLILNLFNIFEGTVFHFPVSTISS